MPPVIAPPGQANIAHNAADPASRNQNPMAMAPDLLELVVELLIFGNGPELTSVGRIFLQRPVWWRCDNQMNGLICNPIEVAGITLMYNVGRLQRQCGSCGYCCHHPNDRWTNVGLQDPIGRPSMQN